MALFDIVWIPVVGLSLALSASALVAKARYTWHSPDTGLAAKVSFTVLAMAAVCLIVWSEWHLAHRFARALLSFF